jgi:hypothetical protein
MTKEILMKGLSIGIITLFMSITVLSAFSTGQTLNKKETDQERGITNTMNAALGTRGNTIEITLSEYRPDGTCVTRVVELSVKAAREIIKTFQNPQDSPEKFNILKKHGLLNRDATLNDWRNGMCDRAKSLGILPGEIQTLFHVGMESARLKVPLMINGFSKVDVVSVIGSRTRIGVPFYRGFMKLFTRFRFVDLIDVCTGLVGIINTKNLIRQHSFIAIPSIIGMVGFVGMHMHIPLILNIYTGFAALTCAGGLGIHTVDFLPWLPLPNME